MMGERDYCCKEETGAGNSGCAGKSVKCTLPPCGNYTGKMNVM